MSKEAANGIRVGDWVRHRDHGIISRVAGVGTVGNPQVPVFAVGAGHRWWQEKCVRVQPPKDAPPRKILTRAFLEDWARSNAIELHTFTVVDQVVDQVYWRARRARQQPQGTFSYSVYPSGVTIYRALLAAYRACK